MKYLTFFLLFFCLSPCQAQSDGNLKTQSFGKDPDLAGQAKAYFESRNYDKASELYRLAALHAEQTGANEARVAALTQLALIQEVRRDYSGALDYLRRAYDVADSLRISKKANDNTAEMYSHNFMTEVEGTIKQETPTIDSIIRTIATKQSLNDTLALSINYFNLGLLYKNKQMYPQALNALKSCLTYATKINYADMQLSAVNQIADIYEFTGDNKQALAYLKKRRAIVDLLNSPAAKTAEDLKINYEQREAQVLSQQFEISKRNYWMVGISVVIVLLLIIGFIYYKQTQLKQRNIAMQAIIQTEESERQRIARDLHDSVSQTMSAAKINLSIIGSELPFKDEEQQKRFDRVLGMVDDGFKEVRTISHNMMPWALHKTGLAKVVKQFISNVENGSISFNFFSQGFDEPFNDTVELILYRVLQESVNNVIKHAGADRVDVSLIRDERSISLTIEDNGRGFDTSDPDFNAGMGLGNLRSRINFLKGKVDVDSQPGSGTLISVYIPVSTL
nr:histidine kinase [uncultured Mucilaginibacter sp.]